MICLDDGSERTTIKITDLLKYFSDSTIISSDQMKTVSEILQEQVNPSNWNLNEILTLSCIMLQNGQTCLKNLAVWTPQDFKSCLAILTTLRMKGLKRNFKSEGESAFDWKSLIWILSGVCLILKILENPKKKTSMMESISRSLQNLSDCNETRFELTTSLAKRLSVLVRARWLWD